MHIFSYLSIFQSHLRCGGMKFKTTKRKKNITLSLLMKIELLRKMQLDSIIVRRDN